MGTAHGYGISVRVTCIFLTLRNTIRRCLADDRYDAFPFDGSRFLLRPHGIESIGSDTDQTAVAPCPIGVEIIADLRSLQYGYAQRRDRTGIIGTEIDDRHLALRIGARSVLGSRSGHRQFAVGIGDLPLVGFGYRILDHALRLDLETLGLAVGEIGQCRSAFDAQIEIRTLSQLDHRPGFVVERDVDIGVVIRDAFEKRGILQCRHRIPFAVHHTRRGRPAVIANRPITLGIHAHHRRNSRYRHFFILLVQQPFGLSIDRARPVIETVGIFVDSDHRSCSSGGSVLDFGSRSVREGDPVTVGDGIDLRNVNFALQRIDDSRQCGIIAVELRHRLFQFLDTTRQFAQIAAQLRIVIIIAASRNGRKRHDHRTADRRFSERAEKSPPPNLCKTSHSLTNLIIRN